MLKGEKQGILDTHALNELACEDAIILEKQRFGRVRTSMMKHLRIEHGDKIANRVLSRINKRSSSGSIQMKESLNKSQLKFDFK
jgi:hypothetical protein